METLTGILGQLESLVFVSISSVVSSRYYLDYNVNMSDRITSTELLKKAFREMSKNIGTSIPGHVTAFDASRQMAQVQIGIKINRTDGTKIIPSALIEVPVYFTGSGDFIIEHEVGIGTEGLILFSQRCIDEWINAGGVADNPVPRFHSLDDAVFIPGIRSQPNKIATFSNDGIKLRNKTGSQSIHLKANGDIDIAAANINITGNIIHTGDQTSTGTITGDVDVIAGTKSGKLHTHVTSTDPSGPPI